MNERPGARQCAVELSIPTLGPFPPEVREVHFAFLCAHPGCDCHEVCCDREEHVVHYICDSQTIRTIPNTNGWKGVDLMTDRVREILSWY